MTIREFARIYAALEDWKRMYGKDDVVQRTMLDQFMQLLITLSTESDGE